MAHSVFWYGSRTPSMHTTENGKLQAAAAAAAPSDAVCACRVYVGMSVYVCLTGAIEVMVEGEGV